MRYETKIGNQFDLMNTGKYSPGQLKLLYDFEHSFILGTGSYRSGKTHALGLSGVRHLVFYPNSRVGIFRQHLASIRKSTLLTFLGLIHPSWVANWSNTYLTLELKNGSIAYFIGAESPDRLGSLELTHALVDEASELSPESLGMISGRLSGPLSLPNNIDELPENIQDYLVSCLDLRQTILATNPKSKNHHLYNTYIKEPKPGHKAYIVNTISNPNLPATYLKNNISAYAKPGISSKWIEEQVKFIKTSQPQTDGLYLKPYLTQFGQRNLLGLWVALEGAIYNLNEEIHLVKKVPEEWGEPVGTYGGVDFGHHNPRLILMHQYEVTTNGATKSCYAAFQYWHKKNSTPDDLIEAMVIAKDDFEVDRFYLPHDQPGITKTARKTLGTHMVKKAKTQVNGGINVCMRYINQTRLVFVQNPGWEVCWNEASGYEWVKDKDGNLQDKPVKKDDHYPDAFRYVLSTRHIRDEVRVAKGTDEDYP